MARPPKTLPPAADRALPAPEAIIERETRQRRTAVYTAIAVALVTALAVLLEQLLASSVPDFDRVNVIEAMTSATAGTEPPKSFLTAVANFKIDHAFETFFIYALRGIAFLLMIPMVLLLMRGARERGGQLAKWLEPIAIGGLALLAIGTFLPGILEPSFYRGLRDSGLTPGAIRDASEGSALFATQIPVFFGSIIICVPFALASLQAYRIGLIPPILGFMGVLVGMLFVFAYDTTGLVRAVWFSGVAFIISGRAPSGLPEAWTTGKATTRLPRQPPAPREKKPKLTK